MTTLHLLCGLMGSGKSTLARQLSAGDDVVRFTLDEWMLRLYPELAFDDADYGSRAEAVRELIWDCASTLLVRGHSVVFDWNSWSRERRAWAVQKAAALDPSPQVALHRLHTSVEESTARVETRTAAGAAWSHHTDVAGNLHLADLIEEPAESEGVVVCHHPVQGGATSTD